MIGNANESFQHHMTHLLKRLFGAENQFHETQSPFLFLVWKRLTDWFAAELADWWKRLPHKHDGLIVFTSVTHTKAWSLMWSDIGQFRWSVLWWQRKPSRLTRISVTVEHLGHAGETNGLNHVNKNVDTVTSYSSKRAEDVTAIKNFTERRYVQGKKKKIQMNLRNIVDTRSSNEQARNLGGTEPEESDSSLLSSVWGLKRGRWEDNLLLDRWTDFCGHQRSRNKEDPGQDQPSQSGQPGQPLGRVRKASCWWTGGCTNWYL